LASARRDRAKCNPRIGGQVEKIELAGDYPNIELVFHAVQPERFNDRPARHEARYPIWVADVADTIGDTRVSFPYGRRLSEPVQLAGALVIWFAEGSYP
jgi:hypothetical protein